MASSEINISYTRAREIQAALRKNLLPIKETGISYEINKNLSIIDRKIADHEILRNCIYEKYFITDGKDTILYAYWAEITDREDARFNQFKLDSNGSYIQVLKEDVKTIPAKPRVNFEDKDLIEELKKWELDIQITFHKINDEKMKDLFDSDKLNGVDISPLFGYLFDL